MKNWDIIYVPEKQPNSVTEPPCVDVIAAVIEPKIANTLIRRLNQLAPLENFSHIKRVRKKSIEGEKIQLSMILCLAHGDEKKLERIPSEVLELVNSYQLSPFIAQVAKYAASSKEEWREQCKLWPTSYHPPTYNIDGITGFSEEDSQIICDYMKLSIELAKSKSQVTNAAVIVDPSIKEIISVASDETHSWHIKANGNLEAGYTKQQTDLHGVSCLSPWKWTDRQLENGCSFHPLRHAALVAIENAAARDLHLYPGSGNIHDHSFQELSVKRQKIDDSNGDSGSYLEKEKPYLCTGCDIFLAWEPCPMCAMALVHQRIRRIFFAFPNPNFGALGSVERLQGEKSLNHHYAVFRVMVPEEVLENAALQC
ncbi:hypothetical protein ACHQM5_018123 [Ranunculus cassubicifolius]